MQDEDKTKEQLIKELQQSCQRVAELEVLETEHKRTETALRESEEKYRSLVMNIPDSLWTTDYTGKTTFISPNVEEVYGYTPEEIRQASDRLWFERIHPDDIGQVKEAYEALFARNVMFDVEYRIQKKDGRWMWLHSKAISTYEKDGVMYADGVFSDITERRQAEEALKESEKRYRVLVENAAQGVFVIQDDVVRFVNSRGLEILGRSEDEIVGRWGLDFVHPEERQRLREIHSRRLSGEPADREYEYRILDKAGRVRWLQANTETIEWAGRLAALMLVTDITERKRAEVKLQEREEILQALINAPTESAMLVDLEGAILAVNEVAARRLGKSTDELIGLSMDAYLPPDLAESRKAQADEVVRSGKPIRFQDERAGRYFDNTIYPVFDLEGKVTAMAIYARDITEIKQAEEEREKLIAELQEALDNVKTLKGLIPICANCKKIRDDEGYWQDVAVYVRDHSEAEFSHGICPDCLKVLYPDLYGDDE